MDDNGRSPMTGDVVVHVQAYDGINVSIIKHTLAAAQCKC